MTLSKKAIENILGKGENAGNQHFLLFAKCCLPFLLQVPILNHVEYIVYSMLSVWATLKFFTRCYLPVHLQVPLLNHV